jgi:hypothetical protein
MLKLIRLAVGCLLVLDGCKTRREKQQVIVIDGWWDDDYANNACWAAKSNHDLGTTACIRGPQEMVHELERDFTNGFQENPACSNVKLFRWKNHKDEKTNAKFLAANWSIQFNMSVRNGDLSEEDSQWQINDMPGEGGNIGLDHIRYADGDMKNPYEAAGKVCRMAKGVGGRSE